MDETRKVAMPDTKYPTVFEVFNNTKLKPMIVRHAEMERVGRNSNYASKCPLCGGTLLIHRDKNFNLSCNDRCIRCGRAFYYIDIEEGSIDLKYVNSHQIAINLSKITETNETQ